MEPVRDPSIDEEFDDKDESEVDSDTDEAARETRDLLNPVERQAITKAGVEVSKVGASIDDDILVELLNDEVESNYDDLDPAADGDSKARDSKRKAEKLKKEIAEQKRANRKKLQRIVIGVLIGVGLSGGGITFLLKYLKESNPKPTDDFPQSALDAAKKLIEQFRARSEPEFWKSIADYVDANALGRQTQSMLMAYTKRLAGAGAKVDWKGVEKGGAVTALLTARDATKKDSDLYRTVATLKHGDVDLPRGARADLCELAVAALWAREG